ncbi:MAG: ferredoxin [Firmicutes bacterium]|uniref:Ferredoxin n=1 Tax=Candidatus Scybalomonas excrementavium TaxID=2840943 RepID=A0A9D9I0J3_9FIRM|nr:ferredoxin [Candidatus Scybalomonas excrementavium]
MKKLQVSKECIACGSCFAMTELIVEAEDGKAIPNVKVGIDESKWKQVEELIRICPVNAISVVDGGRTNKISTAGVEEIKKKAIQELKDWKEVEPPKKEAILFRMEEYDIPLPYASGQYNYAYSTYERARRAARDELDRIMYSKVKVLMQKIIMEYKAKYLQKYFTTECEESYYTELNKKVEHFLEEIATEIKIISNGTVKLPSDFTKFDAYPDSNSSSVRRMMEKHEIYGEDIVERAKREFDSNSYCKLSSYESYFDVDSMEEYVGSGFFGDKYKETWAYTNMEEAIKEIANDVKDAVRYTDIDERALIPLTNLIREYNQKFDELRKEKIEILKNL